MWINLFLCLLGAHLIADFFLQTQSSCDAKREKHWRSGHHYLHALIVFALSWVVSAQWGFWWCALVIGVSHFLIDIWKSYREEDVRWFLADQALHILFLVGVAVWWCQHDAWSIPFSIPARNVAIAVAAIICWRPANFFIKEMLEHCRVKVPAETKTADFRAGALIGDLERWLILAFVLMHHYEALGLLIAAKSIIRFGDAQTKESEYVLAGTLLSISIAVFSGLLVMLV